MSPKDNESLVVCAILYIPHCLSSPVDRDTVDCYRNRSCFSSTSSAQAAASSYRGGHTSTTPSSSSLRSVECIKVSRVH